MKRAFAIIIVLILAIGMIGLFFASFLGASSVSTPAVQTTPGVTTTTQ